MRLRTEAVGGYDFGGLILAAMAVLGLGIVGVGLLIASAIRYGAGRSGTGLFIGGMILIMPALWMVSLAV